MGGEPLRLGQGPDGRGEGLQPLLRQHLHGGGLAEVGDGEAGIKRRVARGGEHVVGARAVVAGGDGRVRPDEYGAGVPDPGERAERVPRLYAQVLRGDAVHGLNRQIQVLLQDVAGVLQRLDYDAPPLVAGDLLLHARPHPVWHFRVVGDEHERRGGAVLALGDQVGGHERRDGGGVSQHGGLAGPGREVDEDVLLQEDLRLGDEPVPRPDDLLHRLDALRAEGHGRDGLGATHLVDRVAARDVEGHEGERADRGRGAAHDLVHPGGPGRHDGHEGGTRVGGQASRDVAPDPIERGALHTQGDAGFDLGGPHVRRELHPVEPLYVVGGVLELVDDLLLHLPVSPVDLGAGDGDTFELDPIELPGELLQGPVAARPHLLYDVLDDLLDLVGLRGAVAPPEALVDLPPLRQLGLCAPVRRLRHARA